MLIKTRHYIEKRDGTTAVEFALVMAPFLWVLIGILELSLAFAAGTNLEGATLNAARKVKTGQAQNASGGATPESVFFDELCSGSQIFVDCTDLKYQVVKLGDNTGFTGADSVTSSFDSDGEFIDENGNIGNSFEAGGISDVVLIRVAYHYDFVTPFMSEIFTNNELGKMTFMSTIVMKNEPYDFEF